MNSIGDFSFRPPRLDEAKQVLDLMIRCDISEYGEPDSDLDDLLRDWESIDLDRDAWLVHTPQGELVGYAAVTPWRINLRFHFYVDPSQEDNDLLKALLEHCEMRGKDLARERGGDNPIKAIIYISHANQQQTELLQRSGYQVVKHVFNMQADLATEVKAAAWPQDITVRCIQPGKDDRQVYDLIQEAFARPGRTPPTFAEWKDFMMRPETFKPDIWFLAEAGGQLVGACLCFEYADSGLGWVRQLGVLAEWRRRGLGAGLLLHSFAEFKRRGFAKAALAVESDNPNAISFYQGVGMEQIRFIDEYQGEIRFTADRKDRSTKS